MVKKLLSFCLAAIMLAASFTLTGEFGAEQIANAANMFSYAESKVAKVTEADGTIHSSGITPWDGSVASEEPTTTEIDGEIYYMLEDGADLAWYSNKVNNGNTTADSSNRESNAVLVNDIDLGGINWYDYRIGQGWYFAGIFDGQGHTIYNLYIETSTTTQCGLFGNMGITGKAATIKNVNFVGAKNVSTYTGAFETVSSGSSIVCGSMTAADSVIQNVSASGTITVSGSGTSSVICAGSIVGLLKKGTVTNCYSNVYIDLREAKNVVPDYDSAKGKIIGIGGIVGVANGETTNVTPVTYITNCGFEGTINAPQNSRVGGVLGCLNTYYAYRIEQCYNTGNITGYRQVAGILGWGYAGKTIYLSPRGIYNTGNITAKTATDSFAAGLINGIKGSSLSYPVYSTGNVTVDEAGQADFNGKCALLFTSIDTAKYAWENCYVAYVPYNSQDGTAKHIMSSNGTVVSSADNTKPYSIDKFVSGEAKEALIKDGYTDNFTNMSGLNGGKFVFLWQTTTPGTDGVTYFIDNSAAILELEAPGYVYLEIEPLGGTATVKVGESEKAISQKGTYAFKADENTQLQVTGKAFLKLNLLNQPGKGTVTDLESTAIKVKVPSEQSRTVVLALYDENGKLRQSEFKANLQPEEDDGENHISAVIDLTDTDVTDCTLKAFVWENSTLVPVEELEIDALGKGIVADETLQEQAIAAVSESYLARGAAIQYDSSDMGNGVSRSTYGTKSPEECTTTSPGYTDEASLCYDVYNEAFGIQIPETASALLSDSSIAAGEYEAAELSENIKTGDILSDGSGRMMLYIGDSRLIYAEGENYDYSSGKEIIEEDGAVKETTLDALSGSIKVIRPLLAETKVFISDKTQNRINNLRSIVVEKRSSHSEAMPAQLGEEITFTFSVTNISDSEKTVSIKDVVPKYTDYVSGGGSKDGDLLKWSFSVSEGETKTVSYTVAVKNDASLYGKYVFSDSGSVNGVDTDCPKILIANTLNDTDQSRVETAIEAMNESELKDAELAKAIYLVGFTRSFALSGTPSEVLDRIFVSGGGASEGAGASDEEVGETAANLIDMTVPTMFGGREVGENAENVFGTARARILYEKDIINGDILIAQSDISDSDSTKMYIYRNGYMMELCAKGMKKEKAASLMESLISCDRYVVLRPAIALKEMNHFPEEKDNLTTAQEAVVTTAYSYLLRGDRMQYDDTRFNTNGKSLNGEFRWQIQQKHPEDYTSNQWGYSNCAAFTYDVYYHALGYDIETWSTLKLYEESPDARRAYEYTDDDGIFDGTEAEKKAIEKEIKNTIKPGDIIVIRRENGSGHAMLYAGNGTIIHSGGGNYNYASTPGKETYEPTVRFKSLDDLFTSGDTCNPFERAKYFALIRPLNDWTGTIPENTINRVENMKGIRAEKLSSHTSTVSVNPGDEILYTFAVYNSNETAVTLDITDVIPENTAYVSGDATVSGTNLSWKITVPAGEKVTATYKVKVNEDTAYGTYIKNDAGKIGGVMVKCPDVLVKNTLTVSEQESIKSAVANNSGSSLTDIELANAIYKEAFGVESILTAAALTDIEAGIFSESDVKTGYHELNAEGTYAPMVVPTIYGGRYFYTPQWDNDRIRLARPNNLVAGDLLLARTSTDTYLMIYDGENFLNLNTERKSTDAAKMLEQVLAYQNYFVVIRPSFVME